MAILVLQGADFSANNMGKIDVPYEFNEETNRILSYYSKSLTDTQKRYLDKIISLHIDAGTWGGIKVLLLPMLAGTWDEMFINAKDGKTLKTATSSTPVEPLSAIYELRVNGLGVLARPTSPVKFDISSYALTSADWSCIGITKDTTWNKGIYGYTQEFGNANGWFGYNASLKTTPTGSTGVYSVTTTDASSIQLINVKLNGLLAPSYAYCRPNDKIRVNFTNIPTPSYGNNITKIGIFDVADTSYSAMDLVGTIGMLMLGNSISNETTESDIHSACLAFRSAMFI